MLNKVLGALDNRQITFYDTLTEDEKKDFQPYVLMRFMSHSETNPELAKLSLIATNEFVNKYQWDLPKEKELYAKLLAASGLGFKQNHKWIAGKNSNSSSDPVKSLVKEKFKTMNWFANNVELNLYISRMSNNDVKDLCDEFGKQKEEAKKIITYHKKIYM